MRSTPVSFCVELIQNSKNFINPRGELYNPVTAALRSKWKNHIGTKIKTPASRNENKEALMMI